MIIREYSKADKNAVLDSWVKASRVAHPFMNEIFLNEMQVKISEIYLPNTQTFVVEIEGKVEGFISLMGNEIGGLFLNPTLHGQGIGLALLNKAKTLHDIIELDVFEKNILAQRFYAKAGFSQIGKGAFEPLDEATLRLKWSKSSL